MVQNYFINDDKRPKMLRAWLKVPLLLYWSWCSNPILLTPIRDISLHLLVDAADAAGCFLTSSLLIKPQTYSGGVAFSLTCSSVHF